ncbi:MAG TPA: site-specific DNA-methyltransferase [Bacteroidales bacterium]|nr:site-specific DNA-methyltransferase [Bacteroidales bacterium]
MEIKTDVILGDCRQELKSLSDCSVDLIITSPPYADQRKNTYGGIHPDDYVEWFLPVSEELLRVLKPTGTFILNIKEKVIDGERSIYVMALIMAMRRQGWLWTEEFIWHKKNSYPGKCPNRFRDAWERFLQFNKNKKFNMYQEAVMVPMDDWANSRLKKLSDTDKIRDNSKVGSGFGKNISNWLNRGKAYPTNVLHLATECGNKNHSAAFPEELPAWFIKLFTRQGDTVLDPFMGSGTTLFVANRMMRHSIGIDNVKEYSEMVREQLNPVEWYLFQPEKTMKKLNIDAVTAYVEQNIGDFHQKRLDKLNSFKLLGVLKSKNPYLILKLLSLSALKQNLGTTNSAFRTGCWLTG